MREKLIFTALIIFTLLSVGTAFGEYEVTFTDSFFNDADWDVTPFGYNLGGSGSYHQETSGGNPGEYREISLSVIAAPEEERNQIVTFHRRIGATYDPSVDGAIDHIDYSEDNKAIDAEGLGQGTGPALRQNGKIYVCGGSTTLPTTWTKWELPWKVAEDFGWLEEGALCCNQNQHPDFTSSGSEMELGFVRWNTTGEGGPAYTTIIGIDNWSFTINQVCTGIPRAVFEAASWGEMKTLFR